MRPPSPFVYTHTLGETLGITAKNPLGSTLDLEPNQRVSLDGLNGSASFRTIFEVWHGSWTDGRNGRRPGASTRAIPTSTAGAGRATPRGCGGWWRLCRQGALSLAL